MNGPLKVYGRMADGTQVPAELCSPHVDHVCVDFIGADGEPVLAILPAGSAVSAPPVLTGDEREELTQLRAVRHKIEKLIEVYRTVVEWYPVPTTCGVKRLLEDLLK